MVALSTIEAKFIVWTKEVKESLCLRVFTRQLGVVSDDVVDTMFYYNQCAIHLSKHLMFHSRFKHTNIKLYFIKDIVSQSLFKLDEVSIEKNPSDMLTKPFQQIKFQHCMNLIRVSHT